ncbi:uracil phosphoribosyltransferase [Fusarium acutatum]|uniref:Uracil phosphoribosyltransferase n=1 Tax=Fusarium acutatum TaxID=78861 RepID=A0A8H4JZC5_9HYPO|nr:uracil phosphoribosyltransferase [Fusarium acutatum]
MASTSAVGLTDREDRAPCVVHTTEDLEAFTQIVYLGPNALVLLFQVMNYTQKKKFDMTGLKAEDWALWQKLDIETLRDLCRQHKFLFTTVQNPTLENALPPVQHFRELAPTGANLAQVKKRLDEIIAQHDSKELQTFFVFDGDRTLSAEDRGQILMDELGRYDMGLKNSAMRDLFSGPTGYSDEAFHQATLTLEEAR